jgi:hypothetical protein
MEPVGVRQAFDTTETVVVPIMNCIPGNLRAVTQVGMNALHASANLVGLQPNARVLLAVPKSWLDNESNRVSIFI